jgi:tape measure domain-containing protein
MTEQSIKFDSKAARDDFSKLTASLDVATAAARRMDQGMADAARGIDRSMIKASKAMERYATVVSMVAKMNFNTQAIGQLNVLAKSLDTLGNVRAFNDKKLTSMREFMSILGTIKVPAGTAGLGRLLTNLSAINTIKIPSTTQVANLRGFFVALDLFKGVPASRNLASLLSSMSGLRVPTSAQITRLKDMFHALQSAKAIPNASKIAGDLDLIAAAAARASHAIAGVNMRSVGGTRGLLGGGAGGTGRAARGGAGGGYFGLSLNAMDGFNGRLKLGYQLGTAFSTVFSAFTLGAFVRNIYQAEVLTQKFNKAMVFVTGTFEGAHQATKEFMAISNDLGLNFEKNADAIGRFTISARAVGATYDDAKGIFGSTTLALQAAGASAQQAEYAFYGLGQMMSKGKVMSEEFNRQVGEQIPGNVMAGVRALSAMNGHVANAAELFNEMRSGNIASLPFLRAWAEEIKRMYEPLKGLIQARPDVAISRLQNAFLLFRQDVSKSGFTGAFVGELNKFTASMVTTTGELSESGQRLASSIGKGLGKAIHLLAQGAHLLMDNLGLLIAALKGLAAVAIVNTVGGWMVSFGELAISIGAATKEMIAFKVAAGSPMGMSGAVGFAKNAGKFGGGFGAAAGAIGYNMGLFRNPNAGLSGTAARAMGLAGATGSGAAPSLGSALGAMAKGAGGMAFNVLKIGFSALIPVLGAAAVALAVFSGKLVKLGDQTVTVGDITLGAGKTIGKRLVEGLTEGLNGFRALLGLSQLKEVSSGDWIAKLMAGLVTIVTGFFSIFQALGRLLAILPNQIIDLSAALALASKGRYGDARKMLGHASKETPEAMADAGEMLRRGFDYTANLNNIRASAIENAKARNASQGDDGANYAMQQQVEAILAQRNLEDQAMRAQGEVESLKRRALIGQTPNLSDEALLKSIALSSTTTEKVDLSLFDKMKGSSVQAADITVGAAHKAAEIAIEAAREAERLRRGPNDVAPGVVLTGGAAAMGAPADIAKAIALASHTTGFNEDVLAAIAKFESGGAFNAHAANPGSSARGLFQFTYDTARRRGLTTAKTEADYRRDPQNAFDPLSSALAAANMLKEENASFKKTYKRDMSGGEAYGDFFLGNPRFMQLMAAYAANPNAPVTSVVPQSILDGNPAITKLMPDKTVKGLLGAFTNAVNGGKGSLGPLAPGMSAAVAGPGMSGAPPGEEETDQEKWLRLHTQYTGLLKGINPAEDTQDALDQFRDQMLKLRDEQEKLKGAKQNISPFMIDPSLPEDAVDPRVAMKLARLQRNANDAANPIGKENRLLEAGNDVLLKRVAGKSEEADWQEKINALVEAGYERSQVDLASERQRLKLAEQRKDLLEAQLDTIKAQNDAEIAGIARSGTGAQVQFAQLIAQKGKPGETLAQTRARIGEGTVGEMSRNVGVGEASRLADVRAGFGDQLSEMQATSRLGPTLKQYREDYKNFLKEFTTNNRDNLALQEGLASDEWKAAAKQMADAKYEFEHPPGFQAWADALEPVSVRLNAIKSAFAEDLSNDITSALVGDDVDWRAMVHNLSREVVKVRVDEMLKGMIGGIPAAQDAVGGLFGGQSAQGPLAALFGRGGAAGRGGASGASAVTPGASTYTLNANVVYLNASSISGGGMGGGSGLGGISSALSSLAANDNTGGTGDGITALLASMGAAGGPNGRPSTVQDDGMGGIIATLGYPGVSSKPMLGSMADAPAFGAPGLSPFSAITGALNSGGGIGGGGFLSKLGGGLKSLLSPQNALGALGILGGLLSRNKKSHGEESPPAVNGVIGEMRGIDTKGTYVPGHSNAVGDALNFFAQMALSSFGPKMFGGGAHTGFGGADLRSFKGMYLEGGLVGSPVSMMALPASAWRGAPSYAQGTHNTSGIPVVVHPEEAIIPLSRGRSIPVDLRGANANAAPVIHSTFNIFTPDADSFRANQASITRKQDRTLRRSAVRNRLLGASG